jgi:hypothetical protein
MRYVLFNWVHPDDAAAWEAATDAEREADVERHRQWFGRYRDKIVSGEELDEVRKVKALRPGRQGEGVVVTDGPYIETKEFLGGFVVIEADSEEDALRIASDWPSLATLPNSTVQLAPVFVRE